MMRPTRVEPVKLMRFTLGCAISASTIFAASSGALVTRLMTPSRQARLAEGLDDQRMGARAVLRGLEHDGVAAGERHRHRADAEDDRRVPRRDREDHADRLAHGHGGRARPVRRDHLAGDLRGHRGRLADHVGGEPDIEVRPMRRAAGLGDHRVGEVVDLRLEEVGGLEEKLAPLAGRFRRPLRERRGGRVGGALGVGRSRPRRRGSRPRRSSGRAGRRCASRRQRTSRSAMISLVWNMDVLPVLDVPATMRRGFIEAVGE